MKHRVWIAGLGLMTLFLMEAAAYDFMERPRAVLPGPAPLGRGVTIARGGYAHVAYRANQFASTQLDQFQVEGYGSHAIIDVRSFRTSMFYGTYMLNGPVGEDDSPGAEAAQWMMNAIQYEYGFVVSWDVPGAGARISALAEYSRRSYHPLRSGFSEPAADLIRIGMAFQSVMFDSLPGMTLDAMVRLGWTELYEFWGASSIPDPRARYTLHGALELRYSLFPSLSAFAVVTPDLILLRSGEPALDGAAQVGVRLGAGPSWIEAYLDGFTTADTEQIAPEVSPAQLLGYGVRFG
ncbi:MAG TPA: hypothetical protein VJ932_05925, partial [Alkalispirochaeta sp.]|nr:hypothetical protein [Alkalispirochaeta sp.]